MGFKLDLTDIEGQKEFTPIPNGKYVVEVTDFKESKTSEAAKNPNEDMISWEYTVLRTLSGETEVKDPKNKGELVNVEGRKIWDNVVLVEKSLFRLKALLDACGFDTSGEIDFDPEEVINSELVIQVGTSPARKNKETGDEYPARNQAKAFFALEEE